MWNLAVDGKNKEVMGQSTVIDAMVRLCRLAQAWMVPKKIKENRA